LKLSTIRGTLVKPLNREVKPWLVIPIETIVRELQSKVLLSCVAAEKGFQVIIGDALSLRENLPWFPVGVFLDKSISPSRAWRFQHFRKLGYSVAAWCEEGLTLIDPNEYLRRKINSSALQQTDYFFAWGQNQADLVRSACPQHNGRVIETSNPRMDLLNRDFRKLFSRDVEKLHQRFGNFIQINLNFSLCNHKKGEGAYISELKKAGKIRTKSDEEFSLGWVAHKSRLFQYFKKVIPEISRAFSDHMIIVRPHPSENHDTWKKVSKGLNNVRVLYEGNVVPWLMAADVVVHNGCTTGLESFMLERPVIAYQPVVSDIYDAHLPNRVSDQVYSLEELIQGIRRRLKNPDLAVDERSQRLSYVRYFVADNNGKWASDIIVDHLWKISIKSIKENRKVVNLIKRNMHRMIARIFTRWNRAEKTEYNLQKFPGLTTATIEDLIAGFNRATGRFSNIECFEFRKFFFLISKT
jgi:surface carbohydrate biosynthesis protein